MEETSHLGFLLQSSITIYHEDFKMAIKQHLLWAQSGSIDVGLAVCLLHSPKLSLPYALKSPNHKQHRQQIFLLQSMMGNMMTYHWGLSFFSPCTTVLHQTVTIAPLPKNKNIFYALNEPLQLKDCIHWSQKFTLQPQAIQWYPLGAYFSSFPLPTLSLSSMALTISMIHPYPTS